MLLQPWGCGYKAEMNVLPGTKHKAMVDGSARQELEFLACLQGSVVPRFITGR